jgi:hypothetical protein
MSRSETTYLSVFPPKLLWSTGDYVNLKIREKGGGLEEIECKDLESGTCGDPEVGFCVVNKDVSEYVHSEHGGTLYINAYSNTVKKECPIQIKLEVSRKGIPTAVPTSVPTSVPTVPTKQVNGTK